MTVRFQDVSVGEEIPSLSKVVKRHEVRAYADAGHRVAIVDLDLQFGDIGLTMGISPERTMYDLVRAHFPEPKAVAAATYNFACFYVRVGRDDEALLRFRHAFELDPSLKEVAGKDPDLDRIRDNPELVELLAS